MIALASKTTQRILRLLAFLALSGLMPGNTIGATSPESTLTLKQAVQIALRQNPDLRLAANRSLSSEITLKKQRGVFLPDLNITTSGNRQAGKSVDPVTGDYTASAYTRFNLNASSSLTLFNGFANTANLHQARENRDAATADLDRTRQGIVYTVAQEFLQSLTARSFVAVEKENKQAQANLLQQITAFFKAGRRPVADLYQQQSEIAASDYRLQEAERAHQVAVITLLQSLGMDPNLEVRLTEPPVEKMVARLQEILDKGIETEGSVLDRADITAQENRVAAARYSVRAARSGYFPRVSASAGLGSSYSSAIPDSDLSDQLLDRNLSANVSLNLSIPLFDRGQTRQEVAAARVQLENQELDLERQRRQAKAEIRQARLNWENAARQLTSAGKQLKYARAALDSVEDRYRANAATLSEVSQSRAQYRQARYNQVAARFSLLLRGMEILYSRGDQQTLTTLVTDSTVQTAATPASKGDKQ